MIVETLSVTQFETNCYVVVCPDTGECLVIDPGGEADHICATINMTGASVKYIVLTHGHIDHTWGAAEIRDMTGAPVAVHVDDASMLADSHRNRADSTTWRYKPLVPDLLLKDGDVLNVGTLKCRVLHTPGHTPGQITLVLGETAFVGDLLFFMGIGRTDFPGGDFDVLMDSIRSKLLPLGNDVEIRPGHGPATTIGLEREHNPFLDSDGVS